MSRLGTSDPRSRPKGIVSSRLNPRSSETKLLRRTPLRRSGGSLLARFDFGDLAGTDMGEVAAAARLRTGDKARLPLYAEKCLRQAVGHRLGVRRSPSARDEKSIGTRGAVPRSSAGGGGR